MIENPVLQIAAAHAWQGLLLLPFAWILLKTLGRNHASVRCSIWTGTLGALVVLPFLSLVELPRIVDFQSIAAIPVAETAEVVTASPAADISIAEAGETAAPASGQSAANYTALAFIGLWLAGFMLQSARLFSDILASRSLYYSSALKPVMSSLLPWQWRDKISIMSGAGIGSPMVLGAFRPRIILPHHMIQSFPAEQLKSILLHELAHVERRDLAMAIVQRIIGAILWWSPWVHFTSGRINEERELACDDRAVALTGDPDEYAHSLLAGFAMAGSQPQASFAVGAFDRPSALKHRILRLTGKDYVGAGLPSSTLHLGAISLLAIGMVTVALATPGAAWDRGDHPNSIDLFVSPLQRVFVETAGSASPAELRRMIDAGARVNEALAGDGSALIMAVRGDRAENVQLLLDQGADVNLAVPGDGNPLIAAAWVGNVDLISLLLARGAEVDAIVRGDETALITAVRKGQMGAVTALVNAGADVSLGMMAPTTNGEVWRSPLSEAERLGRQYIADYLRQHGAET